MTQSTSYSEISKCRVCGNEKLTPVLSLGSQPLSGIYPSPDSPDPSTSPLDLVICDGDESVCRTLQLKHSADAWEMYGDNYGFLSATSPTMRRHLHGIVTEALEVVKLNPGDVVLDIACNDGTLLNFYRDRNLTRIGMDPSSKKSADKFDTDIQVIYDFFSADGVRKMVGDKKCKIVTSIAMFYDLEDPIDFMRQIHSVLAPDGIWVFELSYMPLMLKNLTYGQIMHEHLTYLGLQQIQWMAERANLKILDVSFNFMHGGSFRIKAARNDHPMTPNYEAIEKVLEAEKPLATMAPFERFHNRIIQHRHEIRAFFDLMQSSGKKVYGYGASTKGNIVLNYCGITPQDLIAISDLEPQKDGSVTPGARIPIVSHEKLREAHPDYALVLAWHYRPEIIQNEINYLEKGGKLVFDLPRPHTVNLENYQHYLNASFEDLAFSL